MSEAQAQLRAIEETENDRVSDYLSQPDKEAQVERRIRELNEGLKDYDHLFEAMGSPTYPSDTRQNRMTYQFIGAPCFGSGSEDAKQEIRENRKAFDQALTERLLGAYQLKDDTELGRTVRTLLLDPYFEWAESLNEQDFREQAEWEVMGGGV